MRGLRTTGYTTRWWRENSGIEGVGDQGVDIADSLTVGLVAICRVKFVGETRDAVASLYPTAGEARITHAIVDAASRGRDMNFEYLAEGKGATVTAGFGKDGITLCDPNRAGEGAEQVFQRIYDRPI